jgi:hypothetical protein
MLGTVMTALRWLVLLFAMVAAPAHAADVIYPKGSRVGLAPPPGMMISRSFSGFEDRDKRVALVIATLAGAAYPEIEQSTTAEALQKQGLNVDSREDLAHPLGKAFLVIGHQQIEDQRVRKWVFVASNGEVTALVTVQVPEDAQSAYPDDVIRTALMSVSLRAGVPVEEQLSLLPFQLTELAGFKVAGVLAGRAVMLSDGPSNQPTSPTDTHILIAVAPGGPSQASERGRFAHDVFSVPNVKDVRINSSEPLRIGGQQGHQIMARGKDSATGDEITIVQWLRFGASAYLHLIGIARTDGWTEAYARFRQVRDGIELR